MSTQTAELKFRYELTGDGLRAVNELTGEVVKLAKAEDLARERAEAMKKALASGPGVSALTGRPNSFDSGRPSPHGLPPRYMPPGVRRDNPLLDEAFGASPPVTNRAPRPGDDLNRQRTSDPSLVRALADLTMELRRLPEALRVAARQGGISPAAGHDAGSGRANSFANPTPGRPGGQPNPMPSPGRPGGGFSGMMGVAAIAGIGAYAIQTIGKIAETHATPFMTTNSRTVAYVEDFLGSTPRKLQLFLQRLGSGKDVSEEELKRLEVENFNDRVRRPFEEFRRQFDPNARRIGQGVRDAFGSAADLPEVPAMPQHPQHGGILRPQTQADRENALDYHRQVFERNQIIARRAAMEQDPRRGLGELPLPGLPGTQRGTLSERQQFDRENALLPSRDRQVLAQRELRMTEAQLAEKERLQRTHLFEIEEANRLVAEARRAEAGPRSDVYSRPFDLTRAKDAVQKALVAQEQLKALDQDILDLKTQLAQQRGGVREADAGLARAQLDRMREREGVAADQSRSLALLGPGGRAQAEYAMRLIQESGDISMLPPEIVGMAQSAFPQTVGNLAEQAGQQFASQFRGLAPDEYRDSLPDARRQVDELAAQVRKFEQTNPGQILKETFEAIRGMASFQDRLMKELELFKQSIKAEGELRNNR